LQHGVLPPLAGEDAGRQMRVTQRSGYIHSCRHGNSCHSACGASASNAHPHPPDVPLLRHALRAGFAVRYGILPSQSGPSPARGRRNSGLQREVLLPLAGEDADRQMRVVQRSGYIHSYRHGNSCHSACATFPLRMRTLIPLTCRSCGTPFGPASPFATASCLRSRDLLPPAGEGTAGCNMEFFSRWREKMPTGR
jgi:hypothetical protein